MVSVWRSAVGPHCCIVQRDLAKLMKNKAVGSEWSVYDVGIALALRTGKERIGDGEQCLPNTGAPTEAVISLSWRMAAVYAFLMTSVVFLCIMCLPDGTNDLCRLGR